MQMPSRPPSVRRGAGIAARAQIRDEDSDERTERHIDDEDPKERNGRLPLRAEHERKQWRGERAQCEHDQRDHAYA